MEGYYDSEYSGKGLETPTGQLNIEVKNLPEFKELVEQAKYQSGQLQQTINRLSNFELKIDWNTIYVPVEVDGRQVAKATAKYTKEEIEQQQKRDLRKKGMR